MSRSTDHEPDAPETLLCRFYTHGRRHPIVIGNIQGLRIPPVTPAQIAIGVGSLLLLVMSRVLWAHLGGAVNGFVLVGVPGCLVWAARAVRMEGRAPWRAGLGWLQLLAAPREGVCLGRRDRPMRPCRYRGRTWLAEQFPGAPARDRRHTVDQAKRSTDGCRRSASP